MFPNSLSKTDSRHYSCGGFLFIGERQWFTDPQDYLDFFGKVWHCDDFLRDLYYGALPNGLIINAGKDEPQVVVYNHMRQRWDLKPITDFYDVLSYKHEHSKIDAGGLNVRN